MYRTPHGATPIVCTEREREENKKKNIVNDEVTQAGSVYARFERHPEFISLPHQFRQWSDSLCP